MKSYLEKIQHILKNRKHAMKIQENINTLKKIQENKECYENSEKTENTHKQNFEKLSIHSKIIVQQLNPMPAPAKIFVHTKIILQHTN
jgi:hypothetical protein